ncbi:MAG: hypothetical protein IJA34_17760 [Lachnospiraceae bacterium]|nr:hypothetical protein [Lachnospiraceae bacterium]
MKNATDKNENKVYSVFDKENLEYITDITEDELFEVVAKRVLDRNLEAFKKLAQL